VSGPHHRGHHVSWRDLRAYLAEINQPMRRFLLVWLIAYPAMNGFATLFPLAMTQQFGMNPIMPSSAYAIGVAASLLLYAPVGAATHRLGGARMLTVGFAARLALLGVLAVLGVVRVGWIGWLVLVGFALIQFVWPLLAVATNSLSVRLAPTCTRRECRTVQCGDIAGCGSRLGFGRRGLRSRRVRRVGRHGVRCCRGSAGADCRVAGARRQLVGGRPPGY
jgi:nitrate/nitrite transporter NarK